MDTITSIDTKNWVSIENKSFKFIQSTNVVASQRRKRLSPVLSFSQFRQLCIADRHNDAKKALEGFKNPRANLVF